MRLSSRKSTLGSCSVWPNGLRQPHEIPKRQRPAGTGRIGKSKNIKKRVNQHFTGVNAKSKKIQRDVYAVTFEETGSELIALLKENNEVKKHKPKFNKLLKKIIRKFCLELCENLEGHKYLRICHFDDTINYLEILYKGDEFCKPIILNYIFRSKKKSTKSEKY